MLARVVASGDGAGGGEERRRATRTVLGERSMAAR
jgi:hypothetical protein